MLWVIYSYFGCNGAHGERNRSWHLVHTLAISWMSKMQNAFWTENAQLDYWTLSTSTSMTKVPSNVELVTDKRSVHDQRVHDEESVS